eukprot:1569851-Rhodomonas_salina.2
MCRLLVKSQNSSCSHNPPRPPFFDNAVRSISASASCFCAVLAFPFALSSSDGATPTPGACQVITKHTDASKRDAETTSISSESSGHCVTAMCACRALCTTLSPRSAACPAHVSSTSPASCRLWARSTSNCCSTARLPLPLPLRNRRKHSTLAATRVMKKSTSTNAEVQSPLASRSASRSRLSSGFITLSGARSSSAINAPRDVASVALGVGILSIGGKSSARDQGPGSKRTARKRRCSFMFKRTPTRSAAKNSSTMGTRR